MTIPFYVMLPDSKGQRVALLQKGKSFSLPQFSREDGTRFNTVTSINDAVASAWHVPVSVAYCIAPGENGEEAAFALHNHDENWKPPSGAKWVDLGELKNLVFDSPEQRSIVLDWLSSEEDVIWRNLPWSSSDWLAKATKWIHESVASTGATVTGEPTQVRAWALSCILRVPTTAGTIYFKALPSFFGHEPVLCRYLLEKFPQYMVDLVAIEPDQHWMLSKEWAGSAPTSEEEWYKALSALIEIQQHCNDNVAELFSFGVKDRRLSVLPSLLTPVLDDLKDEKIWQLYGVNSEEAKELSRRIKDLSKLCDRLSECGIPETLMHGDLWSSNVVYRDTVSGKSPLIFDWTDASITHPFFDIYCALTSEKDEKTVRNLKQAHMKAWSEIVPEETVLKAFDLSWQVAPYYYVLAYRNVQLNAPLQSRWELMYLFQRFVRYILEPKAL
jgi:Phosphotransferase enzyme family